MRDRISIPLDRHADRLHHAAARRAPITRVHVDVPAPEASRAVVRVAGATYGDAALHADEIFDPTFEFFTHTCTVARFKLHVSQFFWCALEGLDLWPLACHASALPLS
jgi:hypothetical protein